ncbi:MAG: TonB-dependent receptor, partial [Nitrosospira sp.]
MKQTQNRPVEALWDLQKSIDLNNNRAVYRSKLLLDQDQAARGSSLARIYDNLGFEKRALMETAKSLSLDPASHSSHRFLSDAYINIPRHEIARVSELLQAQLLQPINVNPVQPQLAVADLNIITGTGPSRAGFNEFAPLVERNKPQFVASGILGSNSTAGDETVLSALYGRASVSVGQFHYNTNGFRPNNDQKHNVYNAFVQYAVTPRFNVQAEVRTRKTEQGDLLLDFDPNVFKVDNQRELTQDTARVGARFALSPQQDLITSVIYTTRNEDKIDAGFISDSGNLFNINSISKSQGYQAEAQYLFRGNRFNVTAGAGTYQIGVEEQLRQHFVKSGHIFCLESSLDPSCLLDYRRERTNGYTYANVNFSRNVTTTLGLSYDSYKEGVDFEINKFNPKFGLQWDITSSLRLRLAWFETIKSALVANQTIEPTQVAGFNQLFDDTNGTKARRKGIGVDAHVAKDVYGGFEVSRRDLEVPALTGLATVSSIMKQQESLYRAYLYWLPHINWAVRGEPQFEKFTRALSAIDPTAPSRIETFSAPLSLNYYNPAGLFAKVTTTYVWQELVRSGTPVNAGISDFFLLDTTLGYRLPKRRGIISLEGRN